MQATSASKTTAWQSVKVISVQEETARAKTIRLAVSHWPGHLAGQHVDVRLTGAGGYRAKRSYSIASPPEAADLNLTVQRRDEGEVSAFLTRKLEPNDSIELRGPFGDDFVWSAAKAQRPLLLLGGGSGIVPLMCMLRHWRLSDCPVKVALLYSCRTQHEVIFHNELVKIAKSDPRFELRITLTRDVASGWSGGIGRIGFSAVETLLEALGGVVDSFICGPTGFVETASSFLVQAGQPTQAIRTERFGPSGRTVAV